MKNEAIINLITGYLQSSLTPEEESRLDEYISQGKIDREELLEMKALYQQTGEPPVPGPSPAMRSNFYQMLEEEKHRKHSSAFAGVWRFFESFGAKIQWQVAAGALAVFVIGLLIGVIVAPFGHQQRQLDQLSQQLMQMKQLASLTLLDDSSPISRLKAVNISMSIPSSDQRVIKALLKTLNYDPNVNVRLAAVESLVRHGDNPAARRGLVQSIDRQKSPLVRVALADAMLALRETNSVKQLRELLKKDGLMPSVRQKIQNTVKTLSRKA